MRSGNLIMTRLDIVTWLLSHCQIEHDFLDCSSIFKMWDLEADKRLAW